MNDDKIIKKRKLNIDADAIDDICKCVICHDYIDKKAVICDNSHYTCMLCYNIHNKFTCAYCKHKMARTTISIPYKIYDTLDLTVKCPYNDCEDKILIKDYHIHKDTCKYRYYKCIHKKCNYIHDDNINDVMKHYIKNHGYGNIEYDGKSILCPLDGANGYTAHSVTICKYDDTSLIEITANFTEVIYQHTIPSLTSYPLFLYIRIIPLNYNIAIKKLKFNVKGIKGREITVYNNPDGITFVSLLSNAMILNNYADRITDTDEMADEISEYINIEQQSDYSIYDKYKNYFKIDVSEIVT